MGKAWFPKPVSWILRIILTLVVLFVIWNIYKSRNVETVDQSNLPPINQINQQGSSIEKTERTFGGTFSGTNNYAVSGKVTIKIIDDRPVGVFSDDFVSSRGPDLQVYLSKNKSADGLGEFVSLGSLKLSSGQQSYNLPQDYNQYQSFVIWCRAFNVAFGTADLTNQSL